MAKIPVRETGAFPEQPVGFEDWEKLSFLELSIFREKKRESPTAQHKKRKIKQTEFRNKVRSSS